MKRLKAVVKRGEAKGTILTPHKHTDGTFVVSKTRFEKDYVRVTNEDDLPGWVAQGYGVRMSNLDVASHKSPSLISPTSIEEYVV
jgi:hypothetical protein